MIGFFAGEDDGDHVGFFQPIYLTAPILLRLQPAGTMRIKELRLLQFIEAAAIRPEVFQGIVAQHGLVDRWRELERAFLKESP